MRRVLLLLGLLSFSFGCVPPPPPSQTGAAAPPPAKAPVNAKSRTEVTRTDKRSIPLSGLLTFSAAVDNGTITLTTDPAATAIGVEAEITLRATTPALAEEYLAQVELVERPKDTMLTVIASIPNQWRNPNFANRPGSMTVNYTLTGPPNFSYLLKSANGDITVIGEVDTLEADSTNGAVDGGQGIRRRAVLSSSNGAVRGTIAGAQDVNINTTNGGLTLDLTPAMGPLTGRWSISASQGAVKAALPEIADGGVTLNSGNGSIELTIPGSSTAACEIDTTNGAITLGGSPLTNITKQTATTIRGRLGDGKGLLRVSTINGPITMMVE